MTLATLASGTRLELFRRVLALPPAAQGQAFAQLRALSVRENSAGSRAQARRDPRERRRYAGDPWAYFADILGWQLTPQQEEVLAVIEAETRVLIPSGNNLGKTFLIGGYGVYVMDAVAALEDPDSGAAEQGARVLLPGPDHDTIFETIYSEMLTHAARAEARGHLMPGERSDKSVLWRVRAKWHVEALSPSKRSGQAVAHTASGRHHRNQVALIEEGQGVEEALWLAAEGMCSSVGNKIVSPFNPTEPQGPAYNRAQGGSYKVVHLDAFRHPNVLERRPAIPDAVAFTVIDARVRADCRDRGPVAATPLEPAHGDFVYALPPAGDATPGAREDGVLGSPHGTPKVYRPTAPFTAQVRGQWPTESERGLFNAALLDQAMARWAAAEDPRTTPDAVGSDLAREGRDDIVAAPRWGEGADSLLRRYALAQQEGADAVAHLQRTARLRVGGFRVLPKGDGVDTARELDRLFPDSPLTVDLGGVGASPYDHLVRIIGRDVLGVSFGAKALPRVPGEPWSENLRTQMYVRLAMLVHAGLADLPRDPVLRTELLAHELLHTYRTEIVWDDKQKRERKERVPSVQLLEKDQVKKKIGGRSPDRADAVVLAAHQDTAPRARKRLPPAVVHRSYR